MRALAAVALALCAGTALAVPDIRQRPGEKEKRGQAPAEQRRPGAPETQQAPETPDPNRRTGLKPVAPPEAWKDPGGAIAVPDRWRLLETLNLLPERWYDPYHQNTLKGDKPVYGEEGFVTLRMQRGEEDHDDPAIRGVEQEPSNPPIREV